MLTVDRSVVPGRVLRKGKTGAFRSLVEGEGEPHSVRTDLTGPPGKDVGRHVRSLLTIAHLSDLHVTDVESPARFEFLNQFAGDPRFRELLTMQRPQESLNSHAINAMVQAVNGIEQAPVGGKPVQLVVMTGDAIDNAQMNELANFMALFDGGIVTPNSGGPDSESAQSAAWPNDQAWKPDGGDRFGRDHGFPQLPGLLERASRSFPGHGLTMPWIGCYGNHEELCQGVGLVTPEVAAAMVGWRKPIAVPSGLDANTAVDVFTRTPEAFMTGTIRSVTPDPARLPARLAGFLEAHLRSGSRPTGHGFAPPNRHEGTAGYVYDTTPVRLVCLDTVCRDGGADGRIDAAQLAWLEERLIEVHSSYTDRDGNTARTSNDDRLVVLMSHHPLMTLNNSRAKDAVDPRQLLLLLHRFGNVVLWLNGHVHMNMVQRHPNREGVNVGFWEVTTSSLVDWPCQGRLVEILDAGYGRIGIACTMLDHDGPLEPGEAAAPLELAGLHRLLAANDPLAGAGSPRAGTPADRNVILALPAPFPLRHLHRQ